ncbi:membrane protein [Salinisphaera orenii MK-B5]|uniref:Membrane protein n=2 Tax=Salinisphaera orenii TaxID=856731 RepID=A0A423PWD2_9GAMM|nr:MULTISPECIES: bile acid:sodium symporter family protein [Salinisphaera]ROO29879.1 membrane protein [Salinisphaera orenii MK-B5]ROO30256.1 membrane protein [Salinisphaera halophila YIM 95161]
MKRPVFLPDNFILALVGAIVLATVLPISGAPAAVYGHITTAAIALLFFLHGAKLSREAVYAGATNWRLHLCVLAATFVLFPVLGLAGGPLLSDWLTPELYTGLLFLCVLPSTVQSSIAFTSMARGNVPAAVCSASASNLLGVLVTPLLAGWLISSQGSAGFSLDAVASIVLEILLPFGVGQIARRWVGAWVSAHPKLVKFVDQGAIVLVVYGAFSASVNEGLWQELPLQALLLLLLVSAVLLAIVLGVTFAVGRRFFAREDEIVLLFCGSKKSLASGIPIAKVLFAGGALGAVVLPLMIFHQIQLIVCAVIARRYGRAADRATSGPQPSAGSGS